jgi:hypothetical protein
MPLPPRFTICFPVSLVDLSTRIQNSGADGIYKNKGPGDECAYLVVSRPGNVSGLGRVDIINRLLLASSRGGSEHLGRNGKEEENRLSGLHIGNEY